MKKTLDLLKATLFAATLCLTGMSVASQTAGPAEAQIVIKPRPVPSGICGEYGCPGGNVRCKSAPLQVKHCREYSYE